MHTYPMHSGAEWWHAHQHRYPNSRRVDDLVPPFRQRVEKFLEMLRHAGASVVITSTRRNRCRTYLMHYAWQIAQGVVSARDVPPLPGVDIEWDHGEGRLSRQAAMAMVSLFALVHRPSLTSNHIRGLAIDMYVTWHEDLILCDGGEQLHVTSLPRNGARNRELHEHGRQLGVVKLVTDPPHWSYNGR